jgi:hypothetical protein
MSEDAENTDPFGTPKETQQAKPPALPTNSQGMLARRKMPVVTSINDSMDQVHLSLCDEEAELKARYLGLLDAVYNSQAVEGSLTGDDYAAAFLIREYAKEHNHPLLANAKADTIVHALRVVMNRYQIGRKYRRHMVSGQYVPDENDHS